MYASPPDTFFLLLTWPIILGLKSFDLGLIFEHRLLVADGECVLLEMVNNASKMHSLGMGYS